jgi:hypothetical protein
MTTLRTALVATLLGLAALPAAAQGCAFDLPRLDFPAGPEATRGETQPVILPAAGN